MLDLRDKRNLIGCLFILAMMTAPFIASIFGIEFGLSVLAAALAMTAYLAFDARAMVDPSRRSLVLAMAAACLALALAAAAGAISAFR